MTDFLFPELSFLIGAGSILGISHSYFEFNESKSGKLADRTAIFSDFSMVGLDLSNAIKLFTKGLTLSENAHASSIISLTTV